MAIPNEPFLQNCKLCIQELDQILGSVQRLSDIVHCTGDGLSDSLGRQFTTYDADHDLWPGGNCAAYAHGAWWYNNCQTSMNANLNGLYNGTGVNEGVLWVPWRSTSYSLMSVEMKIRSAH